MCRTYHGNTMSAIPLVVFESDGSCAVNDEALQVLSALTQPVAVVAVAGKYRTGKSFLLNHVLLRAGRGKGFQVGPTTQPCTKGLWLWTEPVQRRDGTATIIIDTEGTGATNSDDSRDTRIFSLALLLASYFVYNSQGSIDEPALANLQVVTNVSKMVHQQRSAPGQPLWRRTRRPVMDHSLVSSSPSSCGWCVISS